MVLRVLGVFLESEMLDQGPVQAALLRGLTRLSPQGLCRATCLQMQISFLTWSYQALALVVKWHSVEALIC